MDKKCNKCGKLFKPRNNNSKYCSRECQYEAYRKPKVDRIKTECQFCGKYILVTEYQKTLGRGKYCSRECKDIHQKEKYLGKNNPMYGKTMTENTRKKKSLIMKSIWESEEFRRKQKRGIEKFVEENGFYPGTDEKSKEKRKKTMVERYGLEHNWNGKYGDRTCDKTTLEKYGKSSAEILSDYQIKYGKGTDIEILFKEILDELSIKYQYKFRIYNETKDPFWYREFDFLIENTKILVEIDGDYWHGNENIFKPLNEHQKETKKKDKIKEQFAIDNKYKVIRFWGSELKESKNKIKNKLINLLKQYV